MSPDVFVIEHSGKVWSSHMRGPNGCRMWPIDEYLARRHHGSKVAARIRRLSPNGHEEGGIIRGWRPHHRVAFEYFSGYETVGRFIRKHGRAAYRALPRHAIKHFGHRKGIDIRMAKEAGL